MLVGLESPEEDFEMEPACPEYYVKQPLAALLQNGSKGRRPAIRGQSVDGRSTQEPAAQVMHRWPAATGRVETAAVGLPRSRAGVNWKSQSGHKLPPDALERESLSRQLRPDTCRTSG